MQNFIILTYNNIRFTYSLFMYVLLQKMKYNNYSFISVELKDKVIENKKIFNLPLFLNSVWDFFGQLTKD